MNGQATLTPSLSFQMVIPSPSLLAIDYCFPSLFLLSFPFTFYYFQSLLDLLCQAFKPLQQRLSRRQLLMFFLFVFSFLFPLISKGIGFFLIVFMDSLKDLSKLSLLIKIKEFQTKVLEALIPDWFCNCGFSFRDTW